MTREDLEALGIAAETAGKILAMQTDEGQGGRIAELERQLADERYGRAVDGAMSGLAFSSASAKRAFAARLAEAALPMADGALEGLDAFVEAYRREDPAAFAGADVPMFVRPGGGTAAGAEHAGALRAAFGLQ